MIRRAGRDFQIAVPLTCNRCALPGQTRNPRLDNREAAGIPLEALVAELRSRCEAVASLQGGSTYFHEELGIFRMVAEAENLYLQIPPEELNRLPDEEGNEHQVWFDPTFRTYLKATWPDFFGMLAIAGKPATEEEIRRFFTSSGWRRFVVEGDIAYFDPKRRVAISDTHRGNIILMDDGLLALIDLRVQSLSGALLDTVTKLAR